jgi:hypothetical protein
MVVGIAALSRKTRAMARAIFWCLQVTTGCPSKHLPAILPGSNRQHSALQKAHAMAGMTRDPFYPDAQLPEGDVHALIFGRAITGTAAF